jgi:hypothetical protein
VWWRAPLALRCCDAVNLECAVQDADLEVVARGAGDCWVSARVDGLRGLAVVLEGRGEGGLQVGRRWHQGSRVQDLGVQGQGRHRYIWHMAGRRPHPR